MLPQSYCLLLVLRTPAHRAATAPDDRHTGRARTKYTSCCGRRAMVPATTAPSGRCYCYCSRRRCFFNSCSSSQGPPLLLRARPALPLTLQLLLVVVAGTCVGAQVSVDRSINRRWLRISIRCARATHPLSYIESVTNSHRTTHTPGADATSTRSHTSAPEHRVHSGGRPGLERRGLHEPVERGRAADAAPGPTGERGRGAGQLLCETLWTDGPSACPYGLTLPTH